MPAVLLALAGPDHRIVATNAAYRAFTGRWDVIGMSYREAFPEIEGQQLYELLDRVYATGELETGKEWRAQIDRDPGGLQEVYGDFTVAPRRATDGTVDGLASGGLLVVPATLAKGLEFDHVIVVEPGRIAAAEARGLHRLYVALTRAVSRLTVLHAAPLPELLC